MNRWFVALIGIAFMSVIVLLSAQNKTLRDRFMQADDKVNFPYLTMFVPITNTSSLDGKLVHLGQATKRSQVIYFFNTRCPHCVASVPAIRKINGLLASDDQTQFLSVSQDSIRETQAYAQKMLMKNISLVSLPDTRSLALYHAGSVPVLMVVDGTGQIRYTHIGRLNLTDDVSSLISAVRAMER